MPNSDIGADTLPGASEPSDRDTPGVVVPPEALAPSGRSEESLPKTAPSPASRDPEADPQDGSTEIPPAAPDI